MMKKIELRIYKLLYCYNPLGCQLIMSHSFSWNWPPLHKVNPWQLHLYSDPTLLAMGDWIKGVIWSKLDNSDYFPDNLEPEFRTREQSCVWLKLEQTNSRDCGLWMKKWRKPTEKERGEKREGKGRENRRKRRRRRRKESQKGKVKARDLSS